MTDLEYEEETQTEKAERRANSAEYTYEVYDALPPVVRKPGAARRTPHNERVEQVREDHPNGTGGKAVLIATYGNDGAGAGAAVVTLNKRFKEQGFVFAARTLPDDSGRKGLFVTYDPVG